MEGVRTFLESSTIHGLTYISTTKKYARLFWILVVISGFTGSILIIRESFQSWSDSPIKTTIETLPISKIKLPKVTVCPPMNVFTDLNYDYVKTENKTLTEEMRDEMFQYALHVLKEDDFLMNNKLLEDNRFYNWYHGYTQPQETSTNIALCILLRRQVHSNTLFYCDVCKPGDKGHRGFEKFEDVVKHVVKENGILETDEKNINELIRIPEGENSLKVFRCMFCPGEGLKFVGLSEEIFLEHISNKHGNKAARRRPEKLRRECRICGELSLTDTELGDHIRRHTTSTSRTPFAGFGPLGDTDQSSSESEDSRTRGATAVVSRSQRRKSRALHSSQKEKFRTVQKSSRSWRRKRAESSVSSDATGDLQSNLEMVQRKRRRLEDSKKERREAQTARNVPRSGRAVERTSRAQEIQGRRPGQEIQGG